jgi:DNA (cytosine-5)-methyltransferase 1
MLKEFQPDFFVFENVPGMMSARDGSVFKDFRKRTQKLGYQLFADVLNSKNFSVLQSRRRIIVIGYRGSSQLYNFQYGSSKNKFKVEDLLKDLPALEPGQGKDSVQEYTSPPTEYLKMTGIRTKKDLLIQHLARPHNERDREIYRRAINKWDGTRKRLRYEELPKKLKTHKNTQTFRDRFKVVASELETSHTITAHFSKDGHYYIHPDINQARSLTLREAARIQSFPDNYRFEGSRTSQYWQLGNAVPPLMAEKIAEQIKKKLEW